MAIRITGLNSGLDTDSIVKELVSSYSTKKDEIVKQQTKLEWKQDAWKTLNSKIYNFYTGLDSMRFEGNYGLKKTTVSDESMASIVAGSKAVIGTQTLEVLETAKTGYLTGAKLSEDGSITGETKLSDLGLSGSASFKIKVNGEEKTLTFSDDQTISDVVTKLSESGVTASFDEKNQRMFISSKESGAAANFTLAAEDESGNKLLNLLGIGAGGVKIDGTDAKIKLNRAEFTSKTNNFVINGLTITAKQVTKGALTISTDTDNQGIYDKIKGFIKDFNELIKEMDTLFNADSAKGFEPLTDEEKDEMSEEEVKKWETKIKDSLLRRDSTLSSVSDAIKTAMLKTYTIDGKRFALSDFGIKTGGYLISDKNEKSLFHIDGDSEDKTSGSSQDKLLAAIANDPEGVADFFTKLTTGVYEALDAKMRGTTLSSAYKVYNDKQMDKEYQQYKESINDWEDKVAYYEEYYYKKFSEMETALSKLQSSQNSLSQLMGM